MIDDGVRIYGLDDMRAALRGVVPKLRVRALRYALRDSMRAVRDAARRAAPVIRMSAPAVRAGRRAPGTLRRNIVIRTSKHARMRGNVGVFVNVRKAPVANRGKYNPRDPYYWRWLKFWDSGRGGWARGFFRAGADALPQALNVFRAKLPAIIARLNRPKAPAP